MEAQCACHRALQDSAQFHNRQNPTYGNIPWPPGHISLTPAELASLSPSSSQAWWASSLNDYIHPTRIEKFAYLAIICTFTIWLFCVNIKVALSECDLVFGKHFATDPSQDVNNQVNNSNAIILCNTHSQLQAAVAYPTQKLCSRLQKWSSREMMNKDAERKHQVTSLSGN